MSASDAVGGAFRGYRPALRFVGAGQATKGQIMAEITTIGLDVAKSVFQVHGIDAAGHVVVSCVDLMC